MKVKTRSFKPCESNLAPHDVEKSAFPKFYFFPIDGKFYNRFHLGLMSFSLLGTRQFRTATEN
jgi:hypothetical protein